MLRGLQGWHLLLLLLVIAGFIAFWAVVALLIRMLNQGGSRTSASRPAAPDALRTLDERLARGEIDPTESAERRHLIEAGGSR
ncbi:MAG: SHOCT domain-containing protein [Phycicoccus sp.]|nr:SHOCT domain-containing protein [Phycicoccus sp.]